MSPFLIFVIGFFVGSCVGAICMAFLSIARDVGRKRLAPPGRGFGPMDAPSQV